VVSSVRCPGDPGRRVYYTPSPCVTGIMPHRSAPTNPLTTSKVMNNFPQPSRGEEVMKKKSIIAAIGVLGLIAAVIVLSIRKRKY